jgi:hypothetical protein
VTQCRQQRCSLTETETWTCPTCRLAVSTPFCPICGERPLRARDLTLGGLLEQMVKAFTQIDGRNLRSLQYLVSRPGSLTVVYLQGQRKAYLGPVPLFLIANVLFFAIESLTGGRVFTTPIEAHLHTQPWSPLASVLVARRLETMHSTLAVYAPVFDRAVAVNARSLIIVMALSFVIAPAILFCRSGRPLITHAVFSLHLYAFLLLLFCVANVIPAVDKWFGGPGLASDRMDHVISVALVIACAAYLWVAVTKVYGAGGIARALQVAALTTAVVGIVLGYRFALLLITLYTT